MILPIFAYALFWHSYSTMFSFFNTLNFNPLVPELFFRRFSALNPKIGCFRIQTHNRYAHRNFLMISSNFRIENLSIRTPLFALGTVGLMKADHRTFPNKIMCQQLLHMIYY